MRSISSTVLHLSLLKDAKSYLPLPEISWMKEQTLGHSRLERKVLRWHWVNEVSRSDHLPLRSFLLGQDHLKNPMNLVHWRPNWLDPFLFSWFLSQLLMFWTQNYIFSCDPREMVQFSRRFVGTEHASWNRWQNGGSEVSHSSNQSVWLPLILSKLDINRKCLIAQRENIAEIPTLPIWCITSCFPDFHQILPIYQEILSTRQKKIAYFN